MIYKNTLFIFEDTKFDLDFFRRNLGAFFHRNDIFEKVISELDYEKFMSSYCGASCSMEGGRDVNSLRKIDFKRES